MEKLENRTKWCYTIGATGRDMAYTLVSLFLMSYIQYTMKLNVAQFAAISGIMVVCLIWDAINDPLMGIIIENSHLKMGKYKPWILSGVILSSIVLVCMFTIRPQGWSFVIFFGIFYLLWGMTYTMNDIAYWGMLPSLTSDATERTNLVTLMSIFICVGQFSVAGIVPTVIAGNAVSSYRLIALIVALCFVGFQLLTFFGVVEHHHKSEENAKQLSLLDMFKIFGRNKPLISAGIASLLFNIGFNLLTMFGMNFFYFEFGYSKGGNLVFIFTVMYGLGTLLSQFVFPFLTKKFSRINLLKIVTAVIVVLYVLFFLIGYALPKNPVIINTIGFLIFFFQGIFNLVVVILLNNTIEWDEYYFNERHDSIISTVRSFSAKLSSAINQGIVTLVLIFTGLYSISQQISGLETEAGNGALTSEQVLSQADAFIQTTTNSQLLGLRVGMTLIPVIMIGAAFLLILKKYPITEEVYEDLVQEIKKKDNS